MKQFFLCAKVALVALLLCAVEGRAVDRPVTLYGYLYYSDAWTDTGAPVPYYGFYSITTGADNVLQPCAPSVGQYQMVSNSGAYVKGKFYALDIVGSYLRYKTTVRVYDTHTWTEEKSFDLGEMQDETIASDLAYDPVTDVLYAATRPFGNTEQGWLATVDTLTGAFTRLCASRYYSVLAADAKGQLWGLSRDGHLYKVGKDGSDVKIGETGYVPNDLPQSGTIDFRSGKLYWAFKGFLATDRYKEDSYSYILEVDLATAKATPVVTFDRQEQLTAFDILRAHPSAPDNVEDLALTPTAPGALTAQVTFTVPTLTYAQETLTGDITARITLDGTELEPMTLQPGQKVSLPVTVSTYGNHSATLVLTSGSHDGVEASTTGFFGADTPQSVTGLTFTTDAARATATLTWTAPTTGVNGGYIDADNLRYTIYRVPAVGAQTVVVDGETLPEARFTETIDSEMQYMAYRVVVASGENQSEAVTSNWLIAGAPRELPYIETFESEKAFNAYTVIDANGDAPTIDEDFYKPQWKFDPQFYCAFYYTSIQGVQADDWLITPAFQFSTDSIYRLSFQAYGYYGYENDLHVTIGPGYDVAGQERVICDKPFFASQTEPVEYHIDFIPNETDRYIGFHVTTPAGEHTSIDNIYLRRWSSVDVPATPAVGTCLPAEEDDNALCIGFRLPTLTAGGKPLAAPIVAAIYRDGEEMAVFADAAPGDSLTWVDHAPVAGLNTYNITVSNEVGPGIPLELSYDLTEGVPGSVGSFTAVRDSMNNVLLTWQAPAAGTDADGHAIRPERLRYNLQRVTGDTYTTIAEGIAETSFTDQAAAADLASQQGLVRYAVTPFSTGGAGVQTFTTPIVVGKSYTLPYHETWPGQAAETQPWRSEGSSGSWSVVSTGYDPFTIGQDGPGLLNFSGDDYYHQAAAGSYISPYIDLSRCVEPFLSFYLYTAPTYDDGTYLTVAVEVAGTGERMSFPAVYKPYGETAGWHEYLLSLNEWQGQAAVAIVFSAYVPQADGNTIHIDNVSVDALETGIHAATGSSANVRISARGPEISVHAAAGTPVVLFTTDGRPAARACTDTTGNCTLRVQPGVYVVRAAGAVRKVLVGK